MDNILYIICIFIKKKNRVFVRFQVVRYVRWQVKIKSYAQTTLDRFTGETPFCSLYFSVLERRNTRATRSIFFFTDQRICEHFWYLNSISVFFSIRCVTVKVHFNTIIIVLGNCNPTSRISW